MKALFFPPATGSREGGVPRAAPAPAAPKPVGSRPGGPAHLLLHQVQRQGCTAGHGGGRRDFLLAALPPQALEVEGGSPVG